MAQRATIEPSDDGPGPGFLILTPYDPVWVERIKALIPSRDRRFWEASSGWWIAEAHRDVVMHLTVECFGEMDVIDEDGVEETVTRNGQRFRQERLF